jgi:hypothetical protein
MLEPIHRVKVPMAFWEPMLLEQVWQRQRLDADPTRLDQDDWAADPERIRDISDLKGKLRDTDSFGIGYLVSRLRSVCKFETSAPLWCELRAFRWESTQLTAMTRMNRRIFGSAQERRGISVGSHSLANSSYS